MSWLTIKGVGNIMENNLLEDKPGFKSARKFLQEIFKNLALQSTAYYDVTGDLPFIYKERQIHSILVPAMAKAAEVVSLEHPTSKEPKEPSEHGWLDYWALYDNSLFLIEFKHGRYSVTLQDLSPSTQEAWVEGTNQLKKLTHEQASQVKIESSIKIALMLVPFYQAATEKEALLNLQRKEGQVIGEGILTGLTPAPNWISIWLLDERLQVPVKFPKRYELYPCVGIAAVVEEI